MQAVIRSRQMIAAMVVVTMVGAMLLVRPPHAVAAPGDLDLSFSEDGVASVAVPGGGFAPIDDVLIQPDGKILVGGTSGPSTNRDFAVARFNPDGTPDSTFNGGGVVSFDFEQMHERLVSIALQNDGKIILGGNRDVPDADGRRIVTTAVRLNPNGTLDFTFGGTGKVDRALHDALENHGGHVAVSSASFDTTEQRIYLAGWAEGANRFAVTRLLPTGATDLTFGTAGIAYAPFGARAVTQDIAVDSEQRILLSGHIRNGTDLGFRPSDDAGLARLRFDGTPDATFDGDGVMTWDGSGGGVDDHAQSISTAPDGGPIAVAGNIYRSGTAIPVASKVLASGVLDPDFGRAGSYAGSETGVSQAGGIAVDDLGRYLVAGSGSSTGESFVIARLLNTGAAPSDTSFSGDGAATAPCSGGGATAVAEQDDSKLVVAGSCDGQITVARFQGDVPDVPAISDLALTVDAATAAVGVSEVDLSKVDIGALPLFPTPHETTGTEAAPWSASPWSASPWSASPWSASPWSASPWSASPWSASPWSASPDRPPVRSIPLYQTVLASTSLPDTPLSTIPLQGGWSSRLAGTRFEGLPEQSILLEKVLALAPANASIAAITINDVNLASAPLLQRASLQGFLYGGSSLDELSSTADWCGDLASHGFDCASNNIDEASSTLFDLDVAGAPVAKLWFLPHLQVSEADLSDAIVSAFDIYNVDVTRNALGGIPTTNLPVGIATCLPADCPTLADAVKGGHIADADTAMLGSLLARDDLVGSMTFTELLRGVIDSTKLDYSRVDLNGLVRDAELSAPFLRYTASAVVTCTTETLRMRVALPDGFRYVPGSSARSDGDGAFESTDDPTTPRDVVVETDTVQRSSTTGSRANILTWSLGTPSCGEGTGPTQRVRLAFDAEPGIELGAKTSSLAVSVDSTTETLMNQAPVAVGEAFEPNNTDDAATTVVPNVLYLSHISSGDDVDKFKIAPQPEGTRVLFELGHQPDDFDLQLSGPTAPLLGDGTTPLRTQPLADPGLTKAATGEVIGPDTLEDVPLENDAVSHSANSGGQDDTALLVVPPGGGDEAIIATVTSHLGTASDRPFSLRVTTAEPPDLSCPETAPGVGAGVAGTLPNTSTLDPDTQTLFVWNQQRFGEIHGADAAESVRTAIEGEGGLAGFGDVNGLLLPVEGDAQVAASYANWSANQCSVGAANAAAAEVSRVVREYAEHLPNLRFITIIGDDNVVPFLRVPDGLTLANQIDYYPEVVFDGKDNPISAAFAFGYMLTDNVYLDRQPSGWLNHELFTPDFAGGRIVETEDEILAAIAQYKAKPYVEMDDVLVSGYDFLNDLAGDLESTFSTSSSVRKLAGEGWTRQNMLDELNLAPDVAAVNGHFSHSGALTAAGNANVNPSTEVVKPADLAGSAFPPGAVMFSVGCQSGLNVPAAAWIGATEEQAVRLLDWAQTADGPFVGNTGFGYGDTELLAGSELLHSLMAKRLDGTMTLGQALTAAREDYLEAVPIPGVVDEKVYSIATYYGFPFMKVGANGAVADPPAPIAPVAAATASMDTDAATGLPTASFDESSSLATDPVQTPRGKYYEIDGETPLLAHFRPVQPAKTLTVPAAPAGHDVGDVLLTGLSSPPDEADINGVFYTPTIDDSKVEPEVLVQDVAFPAALATVTPQRQVKLFVGQYESDLDRPGFGSQRLFTRMAGKTFFVPEGAPVNRPTFSEIEATTLETVTAFRVETQADQVIVLYKRAGVAEWGRLSLTNTNGVWTGGIAHADVVDYVVQAVRDGWVGTSRGKGRDHQPQPIPDPQGLTIDLTGTQGANGWFTGPVTATMTGAEGAQFEGSVNNAAFQPLPESKADIAAVGLNTLTVRGSDGSFGRAFAPVDTTLPTAKFGNLTEGQVITPGKSYTVEFSCADTGSGVASCEALDPNPINATAGTHTFRVKAVDLAGHSSITTVTYRAGYIFEGFFEPVANPNSVNVVEAGRAVPLKFRLRNAEKEIVRDLSTIKSITSGVASCPADATPNPVVTEETVSTSGLKFDEAEQQFHYNWKTAKSWRGTCRKLTVTFIDGVSKWAFFRFR